MQKAFYTTVSNAELHNKRKGCAIKSDPIPLIKDKFLSEFRSNLDKQKVRKNLGIPDSVNLRWENIEGNLDDAPSLKKYIDDAWSLSDVQAIFPEVQTVSQAMTVLMTWVKSAKGEQEAIDKLDEQLQTLNKQLTDSDTSINNINQWVTETNKTITDINTSLSNLNSSIKLAEDEDNALTNENGLYVKDLSGEIDELKKKEVTYTTDLDDSLTSPYSIGGITSGTSVSDLKNKSVQEILDLMLFPTVTRKLVSPTYSVSPTYQLIEVNGTPLALYFSWTQNDAGEKLSETITPEIPEVFSELKTYSFTGTVTYDAGEYLVDNKGNVTTSHISAGSLSASASIETTYPWYINQDKQALVSFNQATTVEVELIGNPVIKLPGVNTQLTQLQVDGGLGYMDVSSEGWTKGTEILNGITYLTWTKTDSYNSYLKHKITFTLKS